MLVRSVGGGEPWTSQIVPELNPSSNDTITQILGARGGVNAATAVRDYEILDTRLTFQVRPVVRSAADSFCGLKRVESIDFVLKVVWDTFLRWYGTP